MAIQVSRFAEFAEMFAEAERNASDLDAANVKIADLEDRNRNLIESNLRYHGQVLSLEHDLAEVARERDSFRGQYLSADGMCATLRGDLDAAQSLLSESRAEVETLKQRIVSLEERLGTALAKNYDVNQEASKWKARAEQAKDLADKMISVLQPDDWRYPEVPIPVTEEHSFVVMPAPEVAPVPPTFSENAYYKDPDPYPSEVPPEPPQDAKAAPTEHGSSDHEPKPAIFW